MGQALRDIILRPTTRVGIGAALLFQLIFSVVWMTGYDGMTDRTDQLTAGIVNEDPQAGAAIAASLKAQLPVELRELPSMAEAERLLEERELQLIIHIPAGFTAKAASPEGTASIGYTMNESNASVVKSMMTAIAETITASVNKQAIAGGAQQLLSSQLQVPQEQAAAMSAMLSERVTSAITYTNPVQGVNNQMVPLMIVLASFVGAMIMGMFLEQSNTASAAAGYGRWHRYGARVIINVCASLIVSLVGVSLVMAFGGQSASDFLTLWVFEALFILTFLFTTQFFLLLFGIGGMAFNITLLSVQLVTSGAMMPRELLPEFYLQVSEWLPATYAVEGAMNLLFGGPNITDAVLGLLAIMGAAVLLSIGAAALRKPAPSRTAAGSPVPKAG